MAYAWDSRNAAVGDHVGLESKWGCACWVCIVLYSNDTIDNDRTN